jgi:hypothetical protein
MKQISSGICLEADEKLKKKKNFSLKCHNLQPSVVVFCKLLMIFFAARATSIWRRTE